MIDKLEKFGTLGRNSLQTFGNSGLFLLAVFFRKPNLKRLWPIFIAQIYFIGVLSLAIIIVSALFIGMVIGLQGFHTLHKFGASNQLGQLLALSITRELSPVMSALLFAGCAGSAITAEIGLMKATEQLDSMELMGVDPLGRVVYPRFLAGLVALPVLNIIFSISAIYGGYLVGVQWLGLDAGNFWSNMQAAVNFRLDILSGIVKSFVFAIVVIWIAVFFGFSCKTREGGISHATTNTVVYSSLAILGIDFILTAMMIENW